MLNPEVVKKNQEALDKFKTRYPNIEHAFKNDAPNADSYLWSICGFRCAGGCGKTVTPKNLQFYSYSENTSCYECQGKI